MISCELPVTIEQTKPINKNNEKVLAGKHRKPIAPTLRGLGDPEYDEDLPRLATGARPLPYLNTKQKKIT